MKTTPNEVRKLIVEAKKRGDKEKAIKEWSGVSVRTIARIWEKYLKEGTYKFEPYGGNNTKITPEISKQIMKLIDGNDKPSLTLLDIIAKLKLNITESCLSKHLKKIGYNYKKNSTPQWTKKGRCSRKA